MSLALFIKKPVLAATLSLFIFLLGIIGYRYLPIRDYPVLPASMIKIVTNYPGAAPSVMEGFVSTPIEQALAGLDGVDYISSTNIEGQSTITIKFPLGYDIDKILPQVSDRVSSVTWKLPKKINGPTVAKVNPNEGPTGAIMYISFFSKTMNMEQVTSYLTRVVQTEMEGVPGIAEANIYGLRTYAMRVWLNPKLMAAHHVTATDIGKALLTNNLRSASGQLKGKYLLFNVSANSGLSTPKEFSHIVIAARHGHYVRLGDVATVRYGPESTHIVGTQEGKQSIVVAVVPQSKANSIQVANRIHGLLAKLKTQMPPGLHFQILLDKSKFSKASIREVKYTLIEACVFVFIVIFLFLGSFRLLVVPIVTIPLSLLGGCALMLALGYSLNSLTFLAAVLAIGLVVDDAIVVIENVHRHIQMGQSKFDAALNGVTEIRNPIISMTLTVAIVLLPIGFVPGFSGALFKEFAFSMALVVIMSGILALFVSPAMCAKILTNHEPRLSKKIDAIMERFKSGYKHVLRHLIQMRWFVGIIFIGVILAGAHLAKLTPSQLIPSEDEGVIVALGFAPSGMNMDYTIKYGELFNKIYGKYPYMYTYGVFYGFPSLPTQTNSFIVLKPLNTLPLSEDQILTYIGNKLKAIPGLLAFAVKMPTLPGAMSMQNVNFVLKTTKSYEDLSNAMDTLLLGAGKSPAIANAQVNLKMNQVQVNVNILREKANAIGVPVNEITNTLSMMLGQPLLNRFGLQGRSYEVIPQTFRRFRMNPSDIKYMYVRALNGHLVPLADVVNITESMTPNTLNQFQLMRSATLNASVAQGHTLGQALHYLQNYVKTNLGDQYHIDYSGRSRQYIQTEGRLLEAFFFAIVLIYLLLTINFTSFRDPLIVMLSVPLSLVGAMYAMYLSGATFNIYTKIGLIMLVGLISKHGILIVNFANMLQIEKGLNLIDAAIEAASIRLRPILMTTAAMIGGAIPLVIATGAGSGAREQIGWVVIGGMALGTCLTLFVVPTAYSILAKKLHLDHQKNLTSS
jgi:hydrophobe/amphiphile efflux-1 (HAE1) family protein